MMVLAMHALIALLHISWVLRTRRTYGAWDRIVDFVVLAQNSGRTDVLNNTSGGVSRFKTFGCVAAIRLVEDETGKSNLELVWRDSSSRVHDTSLRHVDFDTPY
jgi:hypothetical protein